MKLPQLYVCFATHAVQGTSSPLFHYFFVRVLFSNLWSTCSFSGSTWVRVGNAHFGGSGPGFCPIWAYFGGSGPGFWPIWTYFGGCGPFFWPIGPISEVEWPMAMHEFGPILALRPGSRPLGSLEAFWIVMPFWPGIGLFSGPFQDLDLLPFAWIWDVLGDLSILGPFSNSFS